MSVITKKDEKAAAILEKMTDRNNEQEFKDLFKTTYPDDWKKIIAKFRAEERADTKGKGHPMPEPDTYLHNMFNVAKKK